MTTATTSPPLADRLQTLLTLIAGREHEARRIALEVAGESGADTALEECPPALLARAFARAGRRSQADGSLSPAERLALVLVRSAGLAEERAAQVAGLQPDEFRRHLASAEKTLATSPTRRAVILEDHVLTRDLLLDESLSCGLEVVVSTGKDTVAVAAAAAFAPAIAVIDIDLDGAELAGDLAAMQIREVAPECHVLFVTGYPQADRIAAVMQNAAALIKPFRPGDFSAAVRASLRL